MNKINKKKFIAPEIKKISEENIPKILTLQEKEASTSQSELSRNQNFSNNKNIGNKIAQFLQKHIKRPYYYVQPCPNCRSNVTGRYIRSHHGASNDWVIDDALKHGEIVDTISELGSKNCFCLDCGYHWFDFVDMQWFSLEKIKQEKTRRHTREILNERYKQHEEDKKTQKSNFISRYIGKL